MSIISVNFISLENQIERLKSLEEYLEDVNEKVHFVINSVSQMELGENNDELKRLYNRLTEEKEFLSACILKLKKVLELYSDCEYSILSDIDNLPFNMPKTFNQGSAGNIISAGNFTALETGTFKGHSIVNDEWLEKLIF